MILGTRLVPETDRLETVSVRAEDARSKKETLCDTP